jgi:hypothetical protein
MKHMETVMKYLLLLLAFAWSFAIAQTPNASIPVLRSEARTATTVNSIDMGNFGYRGAHVMVNVTTATSGSYTPHIQAKDPISGAYYDVLVGPAISATGITILKIYPGINSITNGSASDILPSTWRMQLIGASTPNMVLSVSAYLLN